MVDQPRAEGGVARGCPRTGQIEKERNRGENEILRVTESREKDTGSKRRGLGQADPYTDGASQRLEIKVQSCAHGPQPADWWWLWLIPNTGLGPRAPPVPWGCQPPPSHTLLQLPVCQAAQGRRWQRRAGWGRPAGAQSSSRPELQRTSLQTAPRPQVVEHWGQGTQWP